MGGKAAVGGSASGRERTGRDMFLVAAGSVKEQDGCNVCRGILRMLPHASFIDGRARLGTKRHTPGRRGFSGVDCAVKWYDGRDAG